MRSIKTKVIGVLTLLVTISLLVVGSLLIWINTTEMQQEIYLDALTFAELTNNTVVTSFEQFYQTENFLQFRKDVNPLVTKNVDVSKIEVVDKVGALLYDSISEKDVPYDGVPRTGEYQLDRLRNLKPSLLFSNNTIVYARKNADNEWVGVDPNDKVIGFPTGEVVNIIYPNQNYRHNVVYTLGYEALWARIYKMALTIVVSIIATIGLSTVIGLYFANRLVRPVQELEKGVVKIAQGAFGAQIPVVSEDEIGVLASNFNDMSLTLKKNTEELVEKQKLTQELDIAKNIQVAMLPDKPLEVPELDVAGSLTPATRIGGDIYDFLTNKSGDPAIFIADVTGHGVPAGLVASVTHSSLYSYSQVYDDTSKIFKSMNKVVHSKTSTNMFATALLVRWDRKSRSLKYCNAGHEQMIHYHGDTKQIELVERGGMALGMTANIDKLLQEKELSAKSGDVIILYTDGIPEAWKSKTENLGMDAFEKMVNTAVSGTKSAEEIRVNILKQVNSYRGTYPQQDDITLVVIRVK